MPEPPTRPPADQTPSPSLLSRPTPSRTITERARDWVVWFGAARLAVALVSLVAVGAGGYWLLRAPPTPVEAGLPVSSANGPAAGAAGAAGATGATGTTGATGAAGSTAQMPARSGPDEAATSSTAAEILVHVAGAVRSPGVHRLPHGARVVDALTAAGGAADHADADALNQAQVLRDGDRLYVPAVEDAVPVVPGVTPATSTDAVSSAGAGGAAPSVATPVDLNAADAAQLEQLPGIGPATAAAIVAHRDARGPFVTVDDLADVRGIGPAKLDALRGLVTT